jgi:GT2 family glycosyltransferase
MTLTAVVVTFNSQDDLPDCLAALSAAGVEHVVVVDNASQDSSVAIAQASQAKVVCLEKNIGFGSAVNVAAAELDAELLLLVNPDCVVTRVTIEALVDVIRRDKELAAVVPAMRYPDGSYGVAGGPRPTLLKEWISFLQIDMIPPQWLRTLAARGRNLPVVGRTLTYADPRPLPGVNVVDWVSGWCTLIRVSAFKEVRGFDPRFFLYFEDVDICERLRDVGYRVAVVSDAWTIHKESTSTGRVGKRRLYAGGLLVYFSDRGHAKRLCARALARLMGA